MFLYIVGGNRKYEDEPLRSIILYSKKLGIRPILITDHIHLNKECLNYKNLKEFLKEYKINYYIFNDINIEFKKLSKKFEVENSYLLAVNSIWIFKRNIINLFQNRIFNLHIGKLPSQKGAGGASWQILSREKFSAVCIHEVIDKIDEGKILLEKIFDIKNSSSLIEYYKRANIAEKKILKKFLEMMSIKKKFKLKKVNKDKSVYMPRLDTNTHGFIDWALSVDNILNFIKTMFFNYFCFFRTYFSTISSDTKISIIQISSCSSCNLPDFI